ncbi:hypothetical protein AVEN_3714-1 [Araneus ventricosus]|uniref:Uncharacterized protein n=1 Tax=Araneus ventricosus TaxID=182803 RepID=A0A4Y2USY8_ARAVE|nr:hypothetical protein AVEN_3714-1 [Araneus ventricosus]
MKFTRQGKLIFSTADPVCASQLLNFEKIMDTPITTGVIWKNITDRFLIFDIPTKTPLTELVEELTRKNDIQIDIPTKTPLTELAEELTRKNGIEIVEMRRFVKLYSTQEASSVLVTILGTTL